MSRIVFSHPDEEVSAENWHNRINKDLKRKKVNAGSNLKDKNDFCDYSGLREIGAYTGPRMPAELAGQPCFEHKEIEPLSEYKEDGLIHEKFVFPKAKDKKTVRKELEFLPGIDWPELKSDKSIRVIIFPVFESETSYEFHIECNKGADYLELLYKHLKNVAPKFASMWASQEDLERCIDVQQL